MGGGPYFLLVPVLDGGDKTEETPLFQAAEIVSGKADVVEAVEEMAKSHLHVLVFPLATPRLVGRDRFADPVTDRGERPLAPTGRGGP